MWCEPEDHLFFRSIHFTKCLFFYSSISSNHSAAKNLISSVPPNSSNNLCLLIFLILLICSLHWINNFLIIKWFVFRFRVWNTISRGCVFSIKFGTLYWGGVFSVSRLEHNIEGVFFQYQVWNTILRGCFFNIKFGTQYWGGVFSVSSLEHNIEGVFFQYQVCWNSYYLSISWTCLSASHSFHQDILSITLYSNFGTFLAENCQI